MSKIEDWNKELTQEEKETYADMYIEQMEENWLNGEPYQAYTHVAKDICRESGCKIMHALDITKLIAKTHRKRLEDMDYTITKEGGFYIAREAFAEARKTEGSG
ncbi:hypothetical protein A3K73_09355 [Candidatus Pacearchaeota archaeon RBG_13_36_9]|nr:MAG: hypothetical protein A3K73_09355 [Candidatus Pacearchaeota archaeon RBG_13_36_9]